MERNNVVIGSKVVTFRLPADLAAEFEVHCGELGTTHGELLRKMVDERLYPGKAELDSPERLHPELYGVKGSEKIVELVNAQIKEQLQEQLGPLVEEKLELVQVGGLTEAERESLAGLAGNQEEIKTVVGKLVQTNNRNVEMVNTNSKDWGDKVNRLFQYLGAHTHFAAKDGSLANGGVIGPDADSFNKEVELANERLGELEPEPEPEPEPAVIKGKTTKPGYHYLEYLNLSVKD